MPRNAHNINIFAAVAFQVLVSSAYAGVVERQVFGVTLDSDSPTAEQAGGIGIETEVVAYELVTGVSVSQDGSYEYVDTGYLGCSDEDIAVDQQIVVYDGTPDVTDWSINRIDQGDDTSTLNLQSGEAYTFLVRQYGDDSGLGSTAFELYGPGSVVGLPTSPVASECGTITVEFDGTEPLALIDEGIYQYVVVGTFVSDGVTEAIADYDLGYEDLDSPYDLDSYAFYYPSTAELPFSYDDPAWDAYTDYSDDDDDVVLPAGEYTLVITPYEEGSGIVGGAVRARSGNIVYPRAPMPVPALPFLSLWILGGFLGLVGLRKLKGSKRFKPPAAT